MASQILNQSTFEEKLVYYALAASYPIYLFGGLYAMGSIIGWALLAVYLLRLFVEGHQGRISVLASISPIVWLWIVAMIVMQVALVEAHIQRQLGTGSMIKSSIGWMKGWALMALFPLLGNLLHIRMEILIRGCCIAAFSAVPFAAFGLLMYLAGLPGDLYFSPLKAVGGPMEVFQVRFFGLNPETHLPRWQFIGPWAPAAGLMACVYFLICINEQNAKWRNRGIIGALTMCLFCQSRAGWVLFMILFPTWLYINRLHQPWVWMLLGVLLPMVALLGEPIYTWFLDTYQQIKDSRPGSTRVRGILATIAVQRWESEAPIWGHGIVERGPKVVEHMPIGSHHSWYGLLFVKGLVGFFALLIPLAMTSLYMIWLAQSNYIARTGAVLCLVLVAYSFFENLEILAYIYWPALMWLGFCLNPNNLTQGEVAA